MTSKKPKKRYFILRSGCMVGETWAVSPAKARNNYWWKYVKSCDPFAPRKYEPDDFDVVEA